MADGLWDFLLGVLFQIKYLFYFACFVMVIYLLKYIFDKLLARWQVDFVKKVKDSIAKNIRVNGNMGCKFLYTGGNNIIPERKYGTIVGIIFTYNPSKHKETIDMYSKIGFVTSFWQKILPQVFKPHIVDVPNKNIIFEKDWRRFKWLNLGKPSGRIVIKDCAGLTQGGYEWECKLTIGETEDKINADVYNSLRDVWKTKILEGENIALTAFLKGADANPNSNYIAKAGEMNDEKD